MVRLAAIRGLTPVEVEEEILTSCQERKEHTQHCHHLDWLQLDMLEVRYIVLCTAQS